ncbi:hypothetical protein WA026_006932 [Henosepilachna vigintioctopunctata]|uniref:Uncharacterized protein n=1 Tax=Henosepilachna vigintioctopunctata TaxID=420089 RepID=A0AAW1VCE1_9CUCU
MHPQQTRLFQIPPSSPVSALAHFPANKFKPSWKKRCEENANIPRKPQGQLGPTSGKDDRGAIKYEFGPTELDEELPWRLIELCRSGN